MDEATRISLKDQFNSLLVRAIEGRRGGMALMRVLEELDFYNSTASAKHHLNVPGGLVLYSLNVARAALELCDKIDDKLMLCITQHPGVLERPAHWEGGAKQSFDQGMYKADLLLFVKQKDYGPMPKSGKQITLDKKRIYNIKSCSLKAGMYRMELERVR